MQEVLKHITGESIESIKKSVTLCLDSKCIHLSGTWMWEMHSAAIYCSDVMFFPEDFAGTKGIIHPEDLSNVRAAFSLMEDKEFISLDFRIITTYGEVKTISGKRVLLQEENKEESEPVPGKEPWQEVLLQLAEQKGKEFLELRQELMEYTERLHGVGSWLIHKQSGQAWYSDNVFRLHGVAPQSLNAHANTFTRFIYKEDSVVVADALEKAYQFQAPLHIEYRITSSNGELKYVQLITKWFYGSTGQIMLGAILRDVTEERAIADELLAAQSNALLQQQVLKISEQRSSTAFWYINLVTRKASYSDNLYRIYGIKQNAVPPFNAFVNLVHIEDREAVREMIHKMFNEHILPEAEFRIVRPDGKIRYLKQIGKTFITQNNELVMIGVVQDISVQKNLEKKILELNESLSLNKLVAEMSESSAQVTSFVWFADGFMQWSEGFYRFLGYRPGAIEPLPGILHKNIHPADLKTFKDAETLLQNQQSHEDILIRFVSKAGVRQAKISFRQVNYGKDAIIALVQDVSKQTEAQLQVAQNKRYADLLADVVTDLVIFTNIDHTVLHWNTATEQKTGIARDAALYQNLFDVLPLLKNSDFLGRLHSAARGNEFHAIRAHNCYLKKPHDYWLWPLKGEEGEVIGVLHIVHDISKQLELQKQLSERLNFIESLVESSVDRIVVLDRFMNYLYWNKKAEEYYLLRKEQVLGKNILEVFPALRNDPSYQQFRTVLKGETVYLSASVNEETDEYFETYLIPIKDESGEVTAVLWIVHDLSKEYHLAKERTSAANLLHATMDASMDMIQVFEAVRNEEGEIVDFRYVLLNHEAEKWMPGAMGKSLLQLQPGVVEEGIFDAFKQVVETGNPQQYEKHYVHEQFDGWFYQSVVKLNDGVATTTTDITHRKKVELEILRLKEDVAQKAEDKYQAIFNSINQGFSLLEILFDENGKAHDIIVRDANAAQDRIDGLRALIGKRVKEILPGIEMKWIERYGNIAKTGAQENFEDWSEANQRWYDVKALRVGGEGSNLVAILYDDITERKREEAALVESEKRKAFLLKLSDVLKPLVDPIEIQAQASRVIGEYLQVQRVAYAEMVGDEIVISRDYINGVPSIAGRYPSAFFGKAVSAAYVKPGIYAENDVLANPKISEEAKQNFSSTNIRAYAGTTLYKEGRIAAGFAAHSTTPHQWTETELNLIEEVTERTWAAVERAKAEEALRESEENYHSLFDSIDQGFALCELVRDENGKVIDYRYLDLNPAFEKHFNLKRSNVIGKTRGQLFGPDNKALEMYIDVVASNKSLRREFFSETVRLWYDANVIPRGGDQFAVLFENVTDRKNLEFQLKDFTVKASAELKESQHWLEQTARVTPDSITVYNLQKKQPTYLNDRLADWLGLRNSELVEMGLKGRLDLIHAEDRLRVLHHNEKTAAAENGDVITIEYRVRTTDDHIIWLRNRSKVFQRDESGKVTHILSIVQNVTEEVGLREALKKRTQFAETILDAATNRITVFDRNYRFIAWNKRCEEVHGVKREKVIGKTIFEIFPGIENYPAIMNAQERSLRGEYVHVPPTKDGFTGTYLEFFYVPLKNDSGETYAVVNILYDVTDYIRNTEALELLNSKLEMKNMELEQKNEEITSFAFVASHDMKEPLRKIHTFSDWLMEQEADHLSDKGKNLIQKIGASVNRMEVLIEDILVLTKIHSDARREEMVDLNKVLNGVIEEMSADIQGSGAAIQKEELPVIRANANQVFYLFKNLISNAIKFQKPGSTPKITVVAQVVSGSEVKTNAPFEEYLKISFIDNGFGLDKRYAKKIFQVFQRLHGQQEFKGTGMGLAICKKIMENHNGMITVESELGEGSVFSCYFPLH